MKTSSVLSIFGLAATTFAAPQFSPPTSPSGGSSTQNDVVNKAACKALTVIFARGTSESGNVGSVAGPPFFKSLQTSLGAGAVALQGVDYAASWDGAFSGGDSAGSSTMASLVGQAVSQCPSTKVVMSGYSQGAQLVHNAAKTLTAAQTKSVAAVVVFGDPYNGQAVGKIPTSEVDSFCASGDNICGSGSSASSNPGVGSGHLSYGSDADAAAAFVVKTTGVSKSS